MSEDWELVPATEVCVGDTIRTSHGFELFVSRIEAPFLGRAEMMAFIEDTPGRWFKAAAPCSADLERRASSSN